MSVCNKVFDVLPDDAIRSTFEYLKGENGELSLLGDDRAVLATAAVCRNWRDNAALTTERQEAATRLHQCTRLQNVHEQMNEGSYPLEMRQLFQRCNSPIHHLPVLDLGDRMGWTGYIDFIQLEEMNAPVMRFKDREGRPGIALNIQSSSAVIRQLKISRIVSNMSYGIRKRSFSFIKFGVEGVGRLLANWGETHQGVLALFKRSTDPDDAQWTCGWGNGYETIETLYKSRHNINSHGGATMRDNCPACPFAGTEPGGTVIQDLLMNQDPDFKLSTDQNEVVVRRGFSERTVLATALAVMAIGYFVNYYLVSERS